MYKVGTNYIVSKATEPKKKEIMNAFIVKKNIKIIYTY